MGNSCNTRWKYIKISEEAYAHLMKFKHLKSTETGKEWSINNVLEMLLGMPVRLVGRRVDRPLIRERGGGIYVRVKPRNRM